jgi:hypothetical protein
MDGLPTYQPPMPVSEHRDQNGFLDEFHIFVDISVLCDIIHWAIKPRESLVQETQLFTE